MPKKAYKIEVAKSVKKDLLKLPKKTLIKISILIDKLADDPLPSGAKKLKGCDGVFRVRQGDYRILYSLKDDVMIILVLKIAHRSEVYKT